MRISDWSSDVCSSDLERTHFEAGSWTPRAKKPTHWAASWVVPAEWLTRRLADTVGLPINAGKHNFLETRLTSATQDATVNADEALIWRTASRSDERRIGKRECVRVDLGGRRLRNKKKKKQ